MIRLFRPNKPTYLSTAIQEQLLATYQSSGAAVWNKEYIRQPLLQASHNKCAYCETEFIAGQPMEIDHFNPKQVAPDKAMDWENFLPSCRRCNGTKSAHNVLVEPIINPFINDPREHLSLKFGRLKYITPLGSTTIDVLDLNDRDLALARGVVTIEVHEEIDNLLEDLNKLDITIDPKKQRSIIRKATSILRAGTSKKPYTATVATILEYDQDWQKAKRVLIDLGFWTSLMTDLEDEVRLYALPTV